MNKEAQKSLLLLIQTILATSVFCIGIGYIFEKSYFALLEIVLALLVFVVAYNNHLFYKVKTVTPTCIFLGIVLLLVVFI